MQSRLLMKEARISARKAGEYFEAHHIVPVSMGGDGTARQLKHSNIVLLTAKEHWISHALLYVIHKNPEMALAFRLLSDVTKKESMSKRIMSSKLYVEARIKSIQLNHSIETRKKISDYHTGRKCSIETRKKMSDARKGMKLNISDETRKRISDKMIGNPGKRSETFDQFISKPSVVSILELLNHGYSLTEIQNKLKCDRKKIIKIKKLAFKFLYELSMTKCHTT